jgi:hypothetical protein
MEAAAKGRKQVVEWARKWLRFLPSAFCRYSNAAAGFQSALPFISGACLAFIPWSKSVTMAATEMEISTSIHQDQAQSQEVHLFYPQGYSVHKGFSIDLFLSCTPKITRVRRLSTLHGNVLRPLA